MNTDEIIDLLSLHIAARDRRTIGDADVAVWMADVGDLDFADAVQAVSEHFREQPDTWLMAGHVRKRVKANRAKRIERAGTSAEHQALEGRDAGSEEDHRRALVNIRRELADGHPPPFREIEDGRAKAVEAAEARDYQKLRQAWEDERRASKAAEKASREARYAEEEAHSAAVRRFTEAYALLLVLEPEAQLDARNRAIEELGPEASAEDIAIRAAELADYTRVAAVPIDDATRQSLARRGCPTGCPIGTHDPACRFATDAEGRTA